MKIKFSPLYRFVKFSSESGFSLMEVMLGGSLMAAVGLAGAYMMKQQKKAQQKIEHDISLANFHQGFVKTLSESHNCNATLNKFYNGPITASDLALVRTCTTASCLSLDYIKTNADSVVISTSYDPGPTAWIDNKEVWALRRLTILSTVTSTGNVPLRATYTLNPRLGSQTVVKDFFLIARFNLGGFKECLSGQESSMNNVQNDFCKSMNSNLKDEAGKMMKWNENTQSCEPVTAVNVQSCPQGQSVEIQKDGSVLCKAINTGFNGASGSASTCATGQIPKAVYNPTTKAFNMTCVGTATPTTCPGEQKIWIVGGNTCTGTIAAGNTITVVPADSPKTGSATYSCVSGAWQPQGTSTCTPAAPTCPPTVSWTANGNTCDANISGGANPTSVTDSTTPTIGDATFTCHSSGTWVVQGTPNCLLNCPAETKTWGSVGGVTCSAAISSGAFNTAEDTTLPTQGTANYTCTNLGWVLQAGSTCVSAGGPCSVFPEDITFGLMGCSCDYGGICTVASCIIADGSTYGYGTSPQCPVSGTTTTGGTTTGGTTTGGTTTTGGGAGALDPDCTLPFNPSNPDLKCYYSNGVRR
jgi:hypothetical protein